MQPEKINKIYQRLEKEYEMIKSVSADDLSNEETFKQHIILLLSIGNVRLAGENKKFVIDADNKKVIHFLLYYFNGCEKAESMFADKDYKLHKNLMLCGKVGVGKTLLMQIFSDYLKKTDNKNAFENLSVTQMVNYYKLNNHLDKYTYNEGEGKTFEGNPINICLNDIGLQTHLHFGTDTKVLVSDFFHARSEIWGQQRKFAHITTNLSPAEVKSYFNDDFGRLADRFKTYNVINLKGESRR